MTYPSPQPGPPQGHGGSPGSPSSPYAAYGQQPVGAPLSGAPYGQAPTPTGQASYMPPEQLAIPPQAVHHSPGGAAFPGQPYPAPSAQAPAPQYLTGPAETPQYQSYQQYQQHYADSGHGYLSGAVTAPGYSTGGRLPQPGHRPGRETTSSQTLGAGHPVPWHGEKMAALILMLVACGLEFIIYITFILNFRGDGGWGQVATLTALFAFVTPVIWSHYFGLRHLFRNQPVSEMVGLSLWFGLGVLTVTSGFSSDPYSDLHNVVFILLFIVCAICAPLTVRLNQRLRNPQPWNVTLALGACQFILLNNALRLIELGVMTYTAISRGQGISQHTSNTWLMWSNSGGVGLPLAPGLILSVTITALAAAGLFLGMRSPQRRAFRIISVTAASLLTLQNLFVLLVYGLPTSGEHSHKPSDMPVEVLAVIVIGAALIGAAWLAGRHPAAAPPAGLNPRSPYSPNTSSAHGAQGMQSRFRQYSQPPMGGGY
ncbi:annexin A7 [Actinomyces viscosus]|uniref:annexin A7 n=1 Tax=Actinomyces viscosus TaxID=1656 RepID=UPI0028F11E94|nr:annexin A7 [Actinomyces viscosus]